MEKIIIVNDENKFQDKEDMININSFDMNLDELDEMEPIESPAFIWGKWNFVGSQLSTFNEN